MNTEQHPIDSGFGPQTTAEEIAQGADLSSQNIVITGGYAGIGLETTRVLSNAGAKVIVGARSLQKAQDALGHLSNVEIYPLDLANPNSIDQFARQFLDSNRPLNSLINNAGVMATPFTRDARGYEMQFATNHLGHFQLTARLWPALKTSPGARVITLSSAGHRFANVDFTDPNFTARHYDKWVAYGQSKTANVLFSIELDQRGKEHDVRAFAVHPGRILSSDLIRFLTDDDLKAMGITRENGILRSPPDMSSKNIEQGAATTLWCALSPQLNGKGGVYCEDCDISELVSNDSSVPPGVRSYALDTETARSLWSFSEELTDVVWPT